MKTSVLVQSLSRWMSKIATTMIRRCFKAEGESSLLSKHTNLPFTLSLASLSSTTSVSLSLPRSLFFSPSDTLRWIDAVTETLVACQLLNKQFAKGSLSQETSQSEVKISAWACPLHTITYPILKKENMTSHSPTPHATEHSNKVIFWIIVLRLF